MHAIPIKAPITTPMNITARNMHKQQNSKSCELKHAVKSIITEKLYVQHNKMSMVCPRKT